MLLLSGGINYFGDMKNLFGLLFILTLSMGCTKPAETPAGPPVTFTHGVASGDPYAESVVLWTRVLPDDSARQVSVTWEVALEPEFSHIERSGIASSHEDHDFTVKVIADSLKEGHIYYYRFRVGSQHSPVGRTRTAGGDEPVRFAIASCSNYEWGFFNAYKSISEINDLNAVLHLGDYIYEYGPGVYGDTTIGRIHTPAHEIITLSDYRTRYSQYREDPDLQAVHQQHPFITIWDDHEIANNAYVDGAQNHQDDEGDYQKRQKIARQVYYEWMPVRENTPHYRSFSFGNLVDLFMLDERLEGRTQQVEGMTSPEYTDSTRSILGNTQFEWLTSELRESSAVWQLIGNQVIYSYLNWSEGEVSRNMDAWDGYPVEQEKLANVIRSLDKQNVVFVTGDTHSSWAFEVVTNPFEAYDASTSEGAIALEFGVTSINSGNSNERYSDEEVIAREQAITDTPINPHLKYSNLRDHGYMLLQLGREEGKVEFHFVDTLRVRDAATYLGETFYFTAGENHLRRKP